MATQPWFENEDFWQVLEPFFFSAQRLAAAPREVEQTIELLALQPGAQILDLCCGPGRHAVEFARRGFHVTGVDRTRRYLEQARQKAQTAGLELELIEQDMRLFSRPGGFDAAINFYTSFGYFDDPDDDRRVLAHVHESLKPGGALVMELLGKEGLARVYSEHRWSEEPDGTLFLEQGSLAADWGRIDNRWILLRDDMRREFRFSLRLYAATELSALLRGVGFAEVAIHGNLQGSPYAVAGPRLVAVARKAREA